jgi:hypothetical protein
MNERPETDFGRIALRRSLVGNLLAVLISANPWIAPPRWEIPPINLFFFHLLIFIFTAWLAWPPAIRAILGRQQVLHGIGGLLLGLSTLPVGPFTFMSFLRFFGTPPKP